MVICQWQNRKARKIKSKSVDFFQNVKDDCHANNFLSIELFHIEINAKIKPTNEMGQNIQLGRTAKSISNCRLSFLAETNFRLSSDIVSNLLCGMSNHTDILFSHRWRCMKINDVEKIDLSQVWVLLVWNLLNGRNFRMPFVFGRCNVFNETGIGSSIAGTFICLVGKSNRSNWSNPNISGRGKGPTRDWATHHWSRLNPTAHLRRRVAPFKK